MSKLAHILPFMESTELKELALKIINGEVKGVRLLLLFPFLRREDLPEIVDLLIEKGMGKELSYALPFLSKETFNRIYEGVLAGTITGIKETSLYPFMEKDKLKELFKKLVKEANDNPEKSEGYFDTDIDLTVFEDDE